MQIERGEAPAPASTPIYRVYYAVCNDEAPAEGRSPGAKPLIWTAYSRLIQSTSFTNVLSSIAAIHSTMPEAENIKFLWTELVAGEAPDAPNLTDIKPGAEWPKGLRPQP